MVSMLESLISPVEPEDAISRNTVRPASEAGAVRVKLPDPEILFWPC